MKIKHEDVWKMCKKLSEDYEPYGKMSGRRFDCSCGCIYALWLENPFCCDWLICANPKSHRYGLLTFEHQSGFKCFSKSARKKETI